VDTRDTPEQAELRRAARQLVRELGPTTVADLADATRTKRLAAAVRDAGWLELRHDAGDGAPLASGVETAIVADTLGGAAADAAFNGPVLAADLARRASVEPTADAVIAFEPNLLEPATGAGVAVDVDPERVDATYVLIPGEGGSRLALANLSKSQNASREPARTEGSKGLGEVGGGADLTRRIRHVPAEAPLIDVGGRLLTADDLTAWTALGLALTSADLVGVMRGVLGVTVAYASERKQFGVPVGSFQAVQHLLADAHCLMEGSLSVALHASWAVDSLAPDEALAAGRVAKAYCARAARTVCETAIQVHGGIGNTWECLAHVYLRRALLSSQWFGDDAVQLRELQRTRLGVTNGLS
jgi:alkylation response protein AidB-like acyl-CoA dehydrogenase